MWKRNKMHDREIALWNARMRIYFDANVMSTTVLNFLFAFFGITNVSLNGMLGSCISLLSPFGDRCTRFQRTVWDAATCCGNLNYKLDEPTFFFFALSISFLLVALALACDKPVGPSPCAKQRNYFSSLSPSSCVGAQQNAWPGIALWNARMRI